MVQVVERNGVVIKRTPREMRVEPTRILPLVPLTVEIDHRGRPVGRYTVTPTKGFEESLDGVDLTQCTIRVKLGETVLNELTCEAERDWLPFFRRPGPQVHVTENYVSIPPALTITDEIGAVWTLGLVRADERLSPKGEFAFNVLRDGEDTTEIASRIERRGGKVRIFTRHGWKRWTGREFV